MRMSRMFTPTRTSPKPRRPDPGLAASARRDESLSPPGRRGAPFLQDSAMSTTSFAKAERLQKLPPYLFAEIDRKKKAALAAGRDVINLGVGDPDRPTPRPIIESLQKNAEVPAFHQY